MIASSTLSIPSKNAAMPVMKESSTPEIKDISVIPEAVIRKHPCLHQPHAVGIALLDSLHHAVAAAAQVLGVHRLGLRVREGGGTHHHLHEEIAVVEVGGGSVEGGGVKEEEERGRGYDCSLMNIAPICLKRGSTGSSRISYS